MGSFEYTKVVDYAQWADPWQVMDFEIRSSSIYYFRYWSPPYAQGDQNLTQHKKKCAIKVISLHYLNR